MAAVPLFVRGRDLLYCYVVPLGIDAFGNITIPSYFGNAIYNMSGYINFVRPSETANLEMVQSIDITFENYLVTIDSYMLTLGEILRQWNSQNGSTPLLLNTILNADYILVQYAIATPISGSPTIFTYFGVRGDLNNPIDAFGKNNEDLTLRPFTWTDMANNPQTAGPVAGITSPYSCFNAA